VEIPPFSIARSPVTNGEYLEFVEDDGYRRDELWSFDGWLWRHKAGVQLPEYWSHDARRGWLRRRFDRLEPLPLHQPVMHVGWHEAEAFCNWAGRRLPTEAEWEMAASLDPVIGRKLKYPWGDAGPAAGPVDTLANLDLRHAGCVDVAAYPAGDSPLGCRQMLGNVWEWTSSMLAAYPGFEVDMYREYSEPWFGSHRVLRGGAYTSRARLMRNTWRNFYTPNRDDVMTGFRTCAR
jgi:iron(II)-dependent oxidoreductase